MLWIGGTDSIQALQYIIIAALPFTILILGCISLVKGYPTETNLRPFLQNKPT
ncbi:hypothetical protein P4S68_16235 [Pseudoalteromonas sp. Hal099]